MRNWKEVSDNPTRQEIENGMYKYTCKIKIQATKCCELEDRAKETNLSKDWDKAWKAIDKFYSMREYFNEW